MAQTNGNALGEAGASLLNVLKEERIEELAIMSQKTYSTNQSKISQRRDTVHKLLPGNAKPVDSVIQKSCPSFKIGLRSFTFWSVITMAICSSIYNYFFNSAWKNYGGSFLDVSEQEFARIISAASLFNSLGRLISGWVLDYISFKKLYLAIVAFEIINAFTISTFGRSYWVYMVYVCVGMFSLGSHKTMFPTMVTKTFGIEVGRKVYPIVYQCFSTASMI